MKMKRETLKEILLNLDLMANKEVDEKRKISFELMKIWFKSYSENICRDSLLQIWSEQWSEELKESYYDFPTPSEDISSSNNEDPSNISHQKELEILTHSDRYRADDYSFSKVEEALFLRVFNDLFVYLVGHKESYITATSKRKLESTNHLVLLKNDTEAILLDGTELKLEVKAA